MVILSTALTLVILYLFIQLMEPRSIGTIALHRRPDNVRRKHREYADYSVLGITKPTTSFTYHSPSARFAADWDDVF